MDPFWNIPPELRLNILLHLGSPRNIKPLSLASPAMCKQSQVSGLHINRAFVASHLPGELLHDALAIIQFPRRDATGSSETDVAVHHIKRWAAHRLPNPFVVCDVEMIEKLAKLCAVLIAYIEDYIGKATSPFPPRAYHELPDLGCQIPTSRIQIEHLRPSERHRFMRAFLHHELLGKFYCPRLINVDDWDGLATSPQPRFNWDWAILYRYKKENMGLLMLETLRCVHAYICSLYGAMFARCADAWLPSYYTNLDFPDNVFSDHETQAEDLDVGYRARCSMAPTLAMFGFDLLTKLLGTVRSEGTGFEQRATWFRELAKVIATHAEWKASVHFRDFRHAKWDGGPGLSQMLRGRVPDPPVLDIRYRDKMELVQIYAYRQRAWVFFEDAELYPRNPKSPEQMIMELGLLSWFAFSGL